MLRPDLRLPSGRVGHARPRQLFDFRPQAVKPLRKGRAHVDLILGGTVVAGPAGRVPSMRGFLHHQMQSIFQRMFTPSGHALPGAKWLLVQGLFAVTAASGA